MKKRGLSAIASFRQQVWKRNRYYLSQSPQTNEVVSRLGKAVAKTRMRGKDRSGESQSHSPGGQKMGLFPPSSTT